MAAAALASFTGKNLAGQAFISLPARLITVKTAFLTSIIYTFRSSSGFRRTFFTA
jgi:hypothetical protein